MVQRVGLVYGCVATCATFGLYLFALFGGSVVPDSQVLMTTVFLPQAWFYLEQRKGSRHGRRPIILTSARRAFTARVALGTTRILLALHVAIFVVVSQSEDDQLVLWTLNTGLASLLVESSVTIAAGYGLCIYGPFDTGPMPDLREGEGGGSVLGLHKPKARRRRF